MIEVSHSSVGISTGRLGADGSDGKASGTTYAAFSPGSLIIRDQANQQQDVSELSRDVEHANQSISPIFDKAKEQQRLSRLRLIGDVVNQGVDITLTQGQIMANNAGINAAGKWDETKETRKEYWDRVQSTAAYKDISEQYKAGGDLDKGIRAAASAITALAGGDPLKALAQGAAPYMAGVVKDMKVGFDDNPTAGQIAANAIGHAVLGGVIAELSGGNATAGAVGAATGELAARAIKDYLYPDTDIAHLSNGDKDKISNLASLAAILAGSVASDSSAGAVSGHDAGKNAVDNNYLTANQALDFDKEMQQCRKSGKDCTAIIAKYKKISDAQSAEVDITLAKHPLKAQVWDKELAYGGIQATERPAWAGDIFGLSVMRDEEVKAYVQYWNSQDLQKIDTASPNWTKFAAFISDPENQAAVVSLGLVGKDLTKAALSYMGRNSATTTVKASEVGMKWGQGNMKQGMPWEDYVGTSLPADARLPQNFKTFDYYDGVTKTAVSAKSLDTQTLAKLSKPEQIYSSIKGNVDAAAKFKDYTLSGQELNSTMIAQREIRLAVPANTTKTQWTEINRAIEYGKSQGVKITVTQVK